MGADAGTFLRSKVRWVRFFLRYRVRLLPLLQQGEPYLTLCFLEHRGAQALLCTRYDRRWEARCGFFAYLADWFGIQGIGEACAFSPNLGEGCVDLFDEKYGYMMSGFFFRKRSFFALFGIVAARQEFLLYL